jgi:hypothetical protein
MTGLLSPGYQRNYAESVNNMLTLMIRNDQRKFFEINDMCKTIIMMLIFRSEDPKYSQKVYEIVLANNFLQLHERLSKIAIILAFKNPNLDIEEAFLHDIPDFKGIKITNFKLTHTFILKQLEQKILSFLPPDYNEFIN